MSEDYTISLAGVTFTSDGDEVFDAIDGAVVPQPSKEKTREDGDHTQWAVGGNGKFVPVGGTVPKLQAGIYEPFSSGQVVGLERMNVASDGIYELPDMATETVLKEVQFFWESEQKYRHHNLLYKRGLILYGPPGGGKTVTVKLLMNELVRKDGIVVIIHNVQVAIMALKDFRRIEPNRNLIMVMEDLDEIIRYSGEAAVLSLLDGENNIDNVVNIATTNFPEELGARIINRPSRFDRRVYIGMPGEDARRVYLSKTTHDGLPIKTLNKWVDATDGMSIAHLRELVAAVYCLNQPFEEVIDRLKAMGEVVKGTSGFNDRKVGLGQNSAVSNKVASWRSRV